MAKKILKNPKILIIGKGFIGQRLAQELKCELSEERQIKSWEDAQFYIDKYKPDVLINCIGFTGQKNVDDCELHLEPTITANTFVPLLLAEVALRNNVKLVHLSSGCIYHYDYKGKQAPITESEVPDYFDLYYSRTKIYSEQALANLARQFNILIVRLRIPLDDRPHSRNILTKILKFEKVLDIPNSLTYIPDFVDALRHLIKTDARGLFNVTNKGALRYPKLLKVYQKYVPEHKFSIMSYKELGANRTNVVLSCKKLEKAGFKIRPIDSVLEECVTRYLKHAQ